MQISVSAIALCLLFAVPSYGQGESDHPVNDTTSVYVRDGLLIIGPKMTASTPPRAAARLKYFTEWRHFKFYPMGDESSEEVIHIYELTKETDSSLEIEEERKYTAISAPESIRKGPDRNLRIVWFNSVTQPNGTIITWPRVSNAKILWTESPEGELKLYYEDGEYVGKLMDE